MPKLVSAVPKYRKHRATSQAVCTINGRDHYLGPHGSKASRLEYDRLINQWLAAGRCPRFGLADHETGEPSVAELLNAYRKWAEKHYRHRDGTPTGTAHNMRPLMRRLRQWYGSKAVSEFTPLAFKDVIRRLIGEGLSISTVNDAIARIKHMFRWGVSEELVSVATRQALEAVCSESAGRSEAKPAKEIEAVPDDHVDLTLRHLPEVVANMVRLQRATGMRPQEVCDIRPADIEVYDTALLFRPKQHKTTHKGKQRVIVLNRKAQQILAPYIGDDPTAYCFSPRKSVVIQRRKRTEARVTPLSCGNRASFRAKNQGGEKYTSCAYRRAIHRTCSKLFFGLLGYKWSPNQLRHAVAEEIQTVADIEAVAAVLGHAKIDTSQRYAKRNLRLAIETMGKFETIEETKIG